MSCTPTTDVTPVLSVESSLTTLFGAADSLGMQTLFGAVDFLRMYNLFAAAHCRRSCCGAWCATAEEEELGLVC
jgi:hypothetical protein